MAVSDLIFACVYYIINVIKYRGGSYIDSSDQTKNKISTINPVNKIDDERFQYAVTVALNHEEIETHSGRTTKIKPFIYKRQWEKTKFPSEKDD